MKKNVSLPTIDIPAINVNNRSESHKLQLLTEADQAMRDICYLHQGDPQSHSTVKRDQPSIWFAQQGNQLFVHEYRSIIFDDTWFRMWQYRSPVCFAVICTDADVNRVVALA
jgi:hypothetical protein